MKTYIISAFTTCLLLSGLSLTAQDLKISYTIEQLTPETHKVEIFARAAGEKELQLKAVNFSLAFDLTCAHPVAYHGIFKDAWTPFLENALVQTGIELPYRQEQTSARWQFGSADPGLPATSPIRMPLNNETPLSLLLIHMEGSCSNDLFLESQKQNPLNQLADADMKLLDYILEHPANQLPFAFNRVQAEAIDMQRTQILWGTENESNGDFFEIEKSEKADFSVYAPIFREKAVNSSEQITYYQFMEEGQMPALAFYRVRYVEKDGKSTYSQVVELRRESKALAVQLQAAVFPNPTSDYLTVTLQGKQSQQLQIQLSDLNGRLLWSNKKELDAAGFAEIKVDFRSFAQTIYLLEVSDGDNPARSQAIRVVKQ